MYVFTKCRSVIFSDNPKNGRPENFLNIKIKLNHILKKKKKKTSISNAAVSLSLSFSFNIKFLHSQLLFWIITNQPSPAGLVDDSPLDC